MHAFLHLYFCQSLQTLQHGLSAIADLHVGTDVDVAYLLMFATTIKKVLFYLQQAVDNIKRSRQHRCGRRRTSTG